MCGASSPSKQIPSTYQMLKNENIYRECTNDKTIRIFANCNQSINQSIRFIADKLHPYKSSKKPFRTGVHTINFSNAATRET